MHEEKIIGPFTLAQFLYIGIGSVISYILYTYFNSTIYVPGIIITAGIAFTLVLNSPKVIVDEQYIQIKKATSTPENFNSWLAMRLAMIESQIAMMKEKGLGENENLLAMKKLLEKYKTV